jgi:ubiquinone/menaquinone biosynthesis C-methylase UbiE
MTPAPDLTITGRNIDHYATPSSVDEYTRQEGLWDIERRLVTEFLPGPPAALLDIGCGGGRTTVGLAQLGYNVIAIDLSEALLAHARRRFPAIDFRLMDATALSFPAATFDAAQFSYNGIDCIYPVAARERCLAETFRVLKPGGTFILSSHNHVGSIFSGGYWYLRGYMNALRTLAQQWGNPHLREWYVRYPEQGGGQYLYSAPPARTIDQLQRAGFTVVDVRGATGQRDPGRVRRREQHVYFVARKPS